MKAVACFGTQSCACSYSPDSHVCSSQPVFLVCRPLAVCKIIQSRSEAILGDTMLDSYLHITWVRVDETFQHMWDASFAGYCTTSSKDSFTMKVGEAGRLPVDALPLDIEDQSQCLMLVTTRAAGPPLVTIMLKNQKSSSGLMKTALSWTSGF